MMLDFFGMKLNDLKTGEIVRASNYKERYRNLIRYLISFFFNLFFNLNKIFFVLRRTHNNLRITRILICLGEFNMEVYQLGFINFLSKEIFESQELEQLANSFAGFWVHTIMDDTTRKNMILNTEELIKKVYS